MQIVKCGHGLCLSCIKRRPNCVEKDIKVKMCNYLTCTSTFSKFAAERFMEKIEGVCLKVSSPEETNQHYGNDFTSQYVAKIAWGSDNVF